MNTVSSIHWRGALVIAGLLFAGGTAQAQNGAQARQQAHAAQMNFLGWQQSQQAVRYISAEEANAAQEAAAAARAAARRVSDDAKRDWWGSVVVSTADGSWNVILNQYEPQTATRDAMGKCEGTCWPVATFANSCVVPAYSQQGGMYFNHGESKKKAVDAALSTCKAAGGEQCRSPEEQAFCTGWKFAYSAVDRLSHRLELIATSRVAKPKLEFFPGGAEFIAKPLEARGSSTAITPGKGQDPAMNMAQPWTAIAAERDGPAFAMHLGVNQKDAGDTAISKCGKRGCEVVVAWSLGQCGAIVRGQTRTYGGKGASKAAAEESAVMQCVEQDETICPVMLNECMPGK
ncbi:MULTISPECIES: DUF4189 domain-containing protein [unclassified Stenotrophomonas]|uniref:DUF4189 domain-containing protein n=1 Tax=unclassified Stenotrophomonas TaxID=196198 RepID=UPI0012FEF7BF|nr:MULTISPECIES: DUF4189 domain-containing protein [unclassified Stenotrophomonas]